MSAEPAAAVLARLRAAPFATVDALLAPGALVVLAPHPDDESLGCGGLIALARDAGRAVGVVFLTDGTGSHAQSRRFPAARLAALRREEAERACAMLGVSAPALRFLDAPDTRVPREGPEAERLADAVAATLRGMHAGTLLTTWAADPHGDHVAAAMIARRAGAEARARLLFFPVWAWTRADDELIAPPNAAWRLDIAGAVARKRAAIAAHVSQTTELIDDDPSGFRLTPEFIARFAGPTETYLRA